jgi:hypothetical protein
MTSTAMKTYHVTVIERALARYEVEAENAGTAAENWQDGEFIGRDDEALDTEGPSSVRERQPDGSWRKLPRTQWEPEPAAASDPAKDRYVIHSAENDAYWSNEAGWGGIEAADVFTASERSVLRLPIGGIWAALKPYSVLLHYPDYMDDNGHETFYAFVEAPDPIAAVAVAQRQAIAVQCVEIDDPADFVPLLVTAGHHHGEAMFK